MLRVSFDQLLHIHFSSLTFYIDCCSLNVLGLLENVREIAANISVDKVKVLIEKLLKKIVHFETGKISIFT